MKNGKIDKYLFDGGYVALNASAAPTSWNYYISDHLGSTRMVVTSTNTIKEAINYYPYGSEMRMTDPAQQTGKGIYKHYEFAGFDNNQGGENKIDITSAIQEQQKLNDSNPYLQEHNGATYCNFATQNIMKTVASATNDNSAVVTGVANVMISSLKNGSNNNYEVVDYQTAADNAREGGLSIVGYSNPNGHGHLATFAVGENINPKYKETIANIGPKAYSGFVTLNMAISSKKAKTFFIYKTPNFQK